MLEDFTQSKYSTLPTKLVEMSIFRNPYYTERFLRALLAPRQVSHVVISNHQRGHCYSFMIAIRSGVFRSQRGEQLPRKFSPKIHLVGRFKMVVLFLKISGLSIKIQKFHVICGNTCTCISKIVCSSTCICKEVCTYVKEELCTWTHSVVWFTVLTAFAPQTPAVPDAREKLITMLTRCIVCDRITEELRVVGEFTLCVN